ncbi:hypothetical protein [Spongiimicrobium salis]|uniref:hypothetical protein n=1 Tax=Spongiimicrobium salis TaxID=1667022 RepID=UPI00374CFA72
MKIVTDIKEANNLLQSYVGARLQIAFYTESLKRIAVRIWFPDNIDQVIYFIGMSCESINGCFSLSNVDLSITLKMNEKTKEDIITLRDEISGFELSTSGGFSLAQGLLSEFGNSFESFFQD